jgi:hypothetical protein
MKRLLLPAALLMATLVPVAAAAPATTHTLQGTVIAKDSAHHALVVARSGGAVQLVVAPKELGRTVLGRKVVIRYSVHAGVLPVALTVSPQALLHRAVVRGTIVRLAGQHAVINAGGSLLGVTLPSSKKGGRALASARSGPAVGDSVEVEVEIGDDGTLDADTVTETPAPAGQPAASGGEMEVHGKVATLLPATTTVAGSVTITSIGLPVTCAIPAGTAVTFAVGDLVEIRCDLVGDPAAWTFRAAKSEDDHSSGSNSGSSSGSKSGSFTGSKSGSFTGSNTGSGGGQQGSGDDGSAEVEVTGTIAAPFVAATAVSVTVTPTGGGTPVTCTFAVGALNAFAAGDVVKMECVKVGTGLELKEIEKGAGDSGDAAGGGDSHGGGGHDD